MADRRMIGRALSQSKKVNSLSLKAALLWTWAIPWFDSYGYLEADPDFIKYNILPRRDDFSLQELPGLLQELSKVGLWKFFKCKDNEKIVAFDPKFKDFQNLREDRLGEQKFKPSQLLDYSWTTPGVDGSAPYEVKIREVKIREAKEALEHSWTSPGVKEKPKTAFPQKTEEQKKELEDLAVKINTMFPNFRLNLFLQNNNRCHPESILHTLRKLIEYPERIGEVQDPMALCESIIKIEDKNYNAADFYRKDKENKNLFEGLLNDIKKFNQSIEKG